MEFPSQLIVFFCFSEAQPGLNRQLWKNVPGEKLSNLQADSRFPDKPDETSKLDVFDGPKDVADNYGTRIYGYFRVML